MKINHWYCILFVLIVAACGAPPTVAVTDVPTRMAPTPTNAPANALTGEIVYSYEHDIFVMSLEDSSVRQLTTDPEADFDPAWSPDGTQIVFRSHRDGNEEIYVMNADGSNQINISRNPRGDWSPVWSPDGTRIAFFSEREGKSGIWAANTDGSNAIPVGTPRGVNDYPAWSPDSTQIVWNCTMGRMLSNGQGDFEICVANADGTGLKQLTDSAGNNKYPTWSPDGSRIVFVSDRFGWPTMPDYQPPGYDPGNFGDEEIFIMNVDGSDQVNLTNNPREDDSFPAWSPDGRYIIYTRYGCLTVMDPQEPTKPIQLSKGRCAGTDSGHFPDWFQPKSGAGVPKASCSFEISFMDERRGQTDLFAVNPDGSGLRQLTNDTARELAMSWSPDGMHLIFQRAAEASTPELYLMNADGSDAVNLTDNPGDDWTPAWSPDGAQIVFYSQRAEGMSLYSLAFPDVLSGKRDLVPNKIPGTELGASPSWSPDGKRIAYRQELPRNDEIFVIGIDGSDPTNLTKNPANDLSPDWSPDGKTIVFESIRDGNYEIYAVSPDGTNLRRLTNDPLEDQHPRWSPDGHSILYSHHGELYLMNGDGSNPRPLAQPPVTGNFAEWRACPEN